ncbi:HTH domain-containing protein [Halobacteriales archaeon Cl-PHB]
MRGSRQSDRSGELWLRNSVPAPTRERQRRIRDRLEAIDVDVMVRAVPRRIPADDESTHADLRAVIERCNDWTLECGATLAPAVSTRRCYSWDDGHPFEALVLPVAFLVVYDGDDVAGAYPHLRHGTVWTVFDGLAALERATASEQAGAAAPADD